MNKLDELKDPLDDLSVYKSDKVREMYIDAKQNFRFYTEGNPEKYKVISQFISDFERINEIK